MLGAGLLHAGWNALLKAAPGGDPLLDTAAVVAGSSLCALVILPFVPVPDRSAWIFAGASVGAAFRLLRHAGASVSHRRPLVRVPADARDCAAHRHPARRVFLREWPTLQVTFGIALISAGIVSIAFVRRIRHPPAAARWAFANAAIIGVYTLIDGAGARASGNAPGYVVWLTFLEAIPFLAWIALRRGSAAFAYVRRDWRRGLVGGAASLGAYGIVLWAMTRAPVAAVSALRETSVLFATLIGAVWLKEGLGAADDLPGRLRWSPAWRR